MPRTARWTAGLLLVTTLACSTGCESDSSPENHNAASGSRPVIPPVSPAGSSPASSDSAMSPSGATSGSSRPSSAADAALNSYRQMMAAMVQAAATSDPNFPLLAKYATGEALVSLRYSLNADRQSGLVTKGPMHMAPQVTSVSSDGRTAKITDCLDDSQWLKYKSDGSRKDDVAGGRRRTAAEATQVDGDWKVAVLRVDGTGTC